LEIVLSLHVRLICALNYYLLTYLLTYLLASDSGHYSNTRHTVIQTVKTKILSKQPTGLIISHNWLRRGFREGS